MYNRKIPKPLSELSESSRNILKALKTHGVKRLEPVLEKEVVQRTLTFDEIYDAAKFERDAQNWDAAISIYTMARNIAEKQSLHEHYIKATSQMARILIMAGRYDEAVPFAEKSVELAGSNGKFTLQSRIDLVEAYSCTGRYEEAVALAKRNVEEFGENNKTGLYMKKQLFHVHINAGRYDEAINVSQQIEGLGNGLKDGFLKISWLKHI